jgi:hypothetical protein
VDVYVGPHEKASNVYIVHQNHVYGPKKGQYDEDKVMLGFQSARAARRAYLAHYDSGAFFRSITEMPFDTFKKMIFKKENQGEKIAAFLAYGNDDTAQETRATTANLRVLGTNDSEGQVCRSCRFYHRSENGTECKNTDVDQSVSPEMTCDFWEADMREKQAESLEDLFFSGTTARRRNRVWKDMVSGARTEVIGSGLGETPSTMRKTASAKVAGTKAASHAKVADIDKEVEPSGTVGRVSAVLTGKEPRIPKAILDMMARCGLQEALATPSMMGMSLKPEEFQRLLLSSIGQANVADRLDGEGTTFSPTNGVEAPCGSLGTGDFSSQIMRALLPQREDRSYLSPVLVRRVTRISICPPGAKPGEAKESPLLTKIGDAYNWYRQEMAKVATEGAMDAVRRNGELRAALTGEHTSDVFFQKEANKALAVLAPVPLALMYSSSIRGDMEKGRDPGFLKRVIAEHPFLAALGGAFLAKQVLKAMAGSQALERAAATAARA